MNHLLYSYIGYLSMPTASTLSHITPIHPSVDCTVKRVTKAWEVVSKLRSRLTHSPP